jgi:hypothetical protein
MNFFRKCFLILKNNLILDKKEDLRENGRKERKTAGLFVCSLNENVLRGGRKI